MNEAPAKFRVVPLKATSAVDAPEDLTRRLESEGWIRQSTLGEPRLSEIVGTYRRLGYEVRLEANQDAIRPSSCSTGTSGGCSGGAASGCSSGGCSSGSAPVIELPPEDEGPLDLRTIFVRKPAKAH